VPRLVEALPAKHVIGAAAGESHTAVRLHIWGWGKWEARGERVVQQNELGPRLAEVPAEAEVGGAGRKLHM